MCACRFPCTTTASSTPRQQPSPPSSRAGWTGTLKLGKKQQRPAGDEAPPHPQQQQSITPETDDDGDAGAVTPASRTVRARSSPKVQLLAIYVCIYLSVYRTIFVTVSRETNNLFLGL